MKQEELIEAIASLNEVRSLEITRELLDQGCTTQEILSLLNEGVKRVGDSFASGEFFIGDLIVSGMLYRSVIDLFPAKNRNMQVLGRIVIGVAQDDIHDIGKDIIVTMLRAEGFDVIDLGVDVKPERFVHAVETYRPDVLLMSGLMGYTVNCMRRVVDMLVECGMRRDVAILVGGSVVSDSTLEYVGADAVSKDPLLTLEFCKNAVARAGENDA
ncbi:MAG: cobalamin-binding protein [Oscillibacter sp.]|nr:cobalamin-binding protein [Oscillibacter sp.]